MVESVLRYLNRYFPRSAETLIAVVADGVTGNFTQNYVVGQYILIKDTILNDGVYKITTVASNKLTLDATLMPETTSAIVYGLAIPRAVLDLATEISAYTGVEGVSSEKIDDYSIAYTGGSGWQSAYKSRLASWRSVYLDLETFTLGWQNRL